MKFQDGTTFECRMLRLFFAQGIFAERSLQFAIGGDYEKKATDLDVLATEYGTGFQALRTNVEAKSGKNVSKIDRILWLAGLKNLLQTTTSYFLVQEVDQDVAKFANALRINVFTERQLSIWEEASGLSSSGWIARSNYLLYESVLSVWAERMRDAKGLDQDWLLLKDVQRFLRVDSWQHFSYANLNRLIRLAQDISPLISDGVNSDKKLCARYHLGSLFIRLTQYLVNICGDLLTVAPTDFERFIERKLIFGDNDSKSANVLVQHTLTWVHRVLEANAVTVPEQLDIKRLQSMPEYSEPLITLIRRCFERPLVTSNLPITAELLIFGEPNVRKTDILDAVYEKSYGLATQAKGFFCQLLNLNLSDLENIPLDLVDFYRITLPESFTPATMPLEQLSIVGAPMLARQASLPISKLPCNESKDEPVSYAENRTSYLVHMRPILDGEFHYELLKNQELIAERILANYSIINELYELMNQASDTEFSCSISTAVLESLSSMGLTETKLKHREKLQTTRLWCERFIQKAAAQANIKLPYVQITETGSKVSFVTKTLGKKRTAVLSSEELELAATDTQRRLILSELLSKKLLQE